MLRLENEYVLIMFNKEIGTINRIYDKQKKIEYVSKELRSVPFRVEYDRVVSSDYQRFYYSSLLTAADRIGFIFTWILTDQIKIIASIQLKKNSNEISFNCELQNQSEHPVVSLEYPIISNLTQISETGQQDYFAHSFATGFQIRNPLKNFDEESNGFRFMPYPEGFSGATMQFFSYYGLGKGGLYFATYDNEGFQKWLNFFKNDNGLLEASFIHGCEDIGPEKGIHVHYPIVVKTLEGNDWYEAADIYKKWSMNQFWCNKGELSNVDDSRKCKWLLEETGVATFGINAGYDRSEWINQYHQKMDTKMFHILGPDWTGKTQSFGNGIPGGLKDWFPTRFNSENLEVMKSYGDKFAPFEFDYLFNINGADGERGKKALQQIPKSLTRSIDKYNFPFVCPADPFVQELHLKRDEKLQQEVDVDSIYYDISANNIIKVCKDEMHGHSVGAGKQITMAYRKNYTETKEAMKREAGDRYIPMGTEMINEVFLDVLDYYQARAGAQPAAPLEGWNIKELIKSGEAELIPMFTYVYHEYGAVRLDGWGKLVKEIGDLFYFTVARTYLWGGLYELNYEYSPMEVIKSNENMLVEHYYPFEQRGYPFDDERAHYISNFAKMRTGVGNKYLAYGRMLRPLKFVCDKVNLSWFLYNCAKDFKEYNDSGELSVDSIIHSAWQYRDESVGLFFANVSSSQCKLQVCVDMKDYQISNEVVTVRIHIDNVVTELFALSTVEKKEFDFVLPEKTVILVELS